MSIPADKLEDFDELFMLEALYQAEKAKTLGEVPIGAVLVVNGEIISRAHNEVESESSVAAHAELLAIGRASQVLRNWRLNNATLYVTLEPCQMCLGAIKLARVSRVVFGAWDPRQGALGSTDDLRFDQVMNREIEVRAGVLEVECSEKLKDFFRVRRIKA